MLKFGIIGAGEIVRACAHAFKGNDDLCAVAIADVNDQVAKATAKDVAATIVYTDYRQVLANKEVEAVYIATPPALHKQMVLDCIAAGKHVICEKPLAMNVAEVKELLSACQKAPKLKVACCSSRFVQLAALDARRILQSGKLGKLERVGFEMSRASIPETAGWTGWKAQRAMAGGGMLMDWGCYDLDWMTWVLQDQFRPTKVLANLGRYINDCESTYAVTILCEDGLRVDWHRRGAELGPAKDLVEFRGANGGLDVAMVPSNTPLAEYHFEKTPPAALHRSSPATPFLRDWKPAMAYPIWDLAKAVQEDRDPLTPISRVLLMQKVIDACYRSAETGQVVAIE